MKKLSLLLALCITTATVQANVALWSVGGAAIGALWAIVTHFKTNRENPNPYSKKSFLKRLALGAISGGACGFVARNVKRWLMPTQPNPQQPEKSGVPFNTQQGKPNHTSSQPGNTEQAENKIPENSELLSQLDAITDEHQKIELQLYLNKAIREGKNIDSFLENGADANFRSEINHNETPLLTAVESRNLNAVKSLLKQGADPHAKDEDGRTPFILAVKQVSANLDIANAFIKHGTIIDQNTVLYILKHCSYYHPLTHNALSFLAENGKTQNLFTEVNEKGRTLIEEIEYQQLNKDALTYLKLCSGSK